MVPRLTRVIEAWLSEVVSPFSRSEIGTAVQYGINTVCIVMNNGCWGAEKAYQRDFFGERYIGADVPNPPYDKLAELWGAAGFRVERAADLAAGESAGELRVGESRNRLGHRRRNRRRVGADCEVRDCAQSRLSLRAHHSVCTN